MVTVPSGCPQPSWQSLLRTGTSEGEEGRPQGGELKKCKDASSLPHSSRDAVK